MGIFALDMLMYTACIRTTQVLANPQEIKLGHSVIQGHLDCEIILQRSSILTSNYCSSTSVT